MPRTSRQASATTMAELHKIHPVADAEAPPPPPQASSSEKLQPPPPPKKRRSRCCRCLCWTIFSLVALIVAIGATIGILFLAFDPKIPKYSVDRLAIANFTVDGNMTVTATFNMTITMENRNKRIGIYYRSGSWLSAWYDGANLCNGTFPVFYQGHRNKTTVSVPLTGETQLGSKLLQGLQERQQTGEVPLVFRGKVPVRVKLGRWKLPRLTFKVRCDIVVNSLSANNNISLKSSRCKFRLRL